MEDYVKIRISNKSRFTRPLS